MLVPAKRGTIFDALKRVSKKNWWGRYGSDKLLSPSILNFFFFLWLVGRASLNWTSQLLVFLGSYKIN